MLPTPTYCKHCDAECPYGNTLCCLCDEIRAAEDVLKQAMVNVLHARSRLNKAIEERDNARLKQVK